MYINSGYLGAIDEDIVNNEKSLLVTAAGNHRNVLVKKTLTHRPNGRGDFQLIYITSGSIKFNFYGNEEIIPSGNIVVFKPGEPQIYTRYLSDKPETYWIHFTGYEAEAVVDSVSYTERRRIFNIGSSADFRWLIKEIIKELQFKRKNFEKITAMHLRQIFLLMNRYENEGASFASPIMDEIERAAHYFNENYNKNIIVEDYARERLMSPCWFISNFKRVMKLTPMQYIISQKISNAMQLFDKTNLNVNQVARAVGYEDYRYFSRIFKKRTGFSPLEYKKKQKNQ